MLNLLQNVSLSELQFTTTAMNIHADSISDRSFAEKRTPTVVYVRTQNEYSQNEKRTAQEQDFDKFNGYKDY